MSSGKEQAVVALGTVGVGGAAIIGATSTNQGGPILAFVGALLVALIAAFTAERRLERQLVHDRELHDLDGLRKLLDDTSTLMYETIAATTNLSRAVSGKRGEITDETFQKALEAIDEAQASYAKFTPLAGQLLIHFTAEEPLYQAAESFFEVHHKVTTEFLLDPPAEELQKFIEGSLPESGAQALAFRDAARKAAGYRYPR
jgi:hypothetical protein